MALAATRRRNRAIGEVRFAAGRGETRGIAFNHFAQIAAAFPDVLEEIVIETTEEVEERALRHAPRGATGLLARAERTVYRRGTTLTGRVEFFARDPSQKRPDHAYPFYVEVGTVDTPAQPFVVPALVETRPGFTAKLMDLEGRLPQ